MPEDIKPNPAAAPAPSSPPQQAPTKTAIPAEFTGKSVEEVYSALNDRYKDYDSYKERAALADKFTGLKATPEDVEATRKWVGELLGPLSQGKQAMFDKNTNRIVFVDPQGNVTQAPTQPGQQDQDIFADWETLDGRTQAQRLEGRTGQIIDRKANEIVQRYDREIAQAVQRIDQRANLFIDVLERWIENPSLKPKEVLAKLAEYGQGGNALDMVTKELTSPAQIAKQVQEQVAAQMADFKAKWEQEHAAPNMSQSTGMRPHASMGADGKPMSIGDLRKKVIGNWHENGLTR